MTDTDLRQWIDNDEGLYLWWKSSRQSKSAFIKENRDEIVAAVRNVTDGRKPAHYLRYGG